MNKTISDTEISKWSWCTVISWLPEKKCLQFLIKCRHLFQNWSNYCLYNFCWFDKYNVIWPECLHVLYVQCCQLHETFLSESTAQVIITGDIMDKYESLNKTQWQKVSGMHCKITGPSNYTAGHKLWWQLTLV